MSDARDGMEIGDDEEMSEVGSPPEADDVLREALAQNKAQIWAHEEQVKAEELSIQKEAKWMEQFGFKPDMAHEISEWRELAAINRYRAQYDAAGQYLDALGQVAAVALPRLVTASTQIYVRELERMLPLLTSRYKTLVHPPAKFVVDVGVETFNLKEWRASNASARMGSLMWHLECENCTMEDIMQRVRGEMSWLTHPIDRLQRPEREARQALTAYGESVHVIRESRKHERLLATMSMYRRTRALVEETVEAVEDVQRDVLGEHGDTESRSLSQDITRYAFQVGYLTAELPEPSSFYRDTGRVCELDERAFTASGDKITKVMDRIFCELKPMHRRLEQWQTGHVHELKVAQTQVWQAYKDKMTALSNLYQVPLGDNWCWSWADDRGELGWRKRFLRNKRPKSNRSNVS